MDITSYLLGKNSAGGGGGGLDWASLGYNGTPQAIIDGYNYAKDIKDNWIPGTSLSMKWDGNKDLVIFPQLDLSQNTSLYRTCPNCQALISIAPIDTKTIKSFESTFSGCYALKEVPILDFSSATTMYNMFSNCYHLSDKSLDNILLSCTSVGSSYTGTKLLKNLGFNSHTSAARIQALPHYQDFIDAGWTIGY